MTDTPRRDVRNHVLFEVATEVANRVGGIYSVLKSKAQVTTAEYGATYTMLGPLNYASAQVEVEEIQPKDPALVKTIKSMTERGIKTLYGRWLIDGAPRVLLFDTKTAYHKLDEWKGDLWSIAGIPSPPDDWETNEAIYVYHEQERAVVAQFHEWLAGVALPLCKKRRIDVTTIFTTHATLLGRYLCAGSVDFYNNLQYFDVDAEAGKRGIYHRYCIERGAAHSADVFTTVSHITAYESEHLLKRKPDGVLPNGLNVKKFSATHEFQNLHQQSKNRIADFVRGHFYGHNDFEPENTLYLFTAGRYEYRNKGVDMFIESLARLNHRMKSAGSNMTVVAFIIMPAQTTSLTVEALKGQAVIKSLQDTVKVIEQNVGKKLFERSLAWHEGQELPEDKELVTSADKIMLRRRLFAMKRGTLPPIVTHNMVNDADDPILNQIRRCHLFNHPSDRVKVVFHPEFLNSANPVLPMDYDDFVRGTHMGVFSSYYEPWGYTPAECTVMGVPSITTNLSGFGCYMEELIENAADYGIYIVDRRQKGVDDSVNQLCDYMFEFTRKSKRQRINQRNRTERLSDLLDWKRMGMEYVKARQLALRRGQLPFFLYTSSSTHTFICFLDLAMKRQCTMTQLTSITAYPNSFDPATSEPTFFDGTELKISRPLSAPGSPRDRSGMMTPGDFASLQEGREGLSTEDYIAWKLPEEEDPDEYPFPLTLKNKGGTERELVNGDSVAE
ncbi:MAG: glycogen synthase isoform 1 [Bathelium mastoideum]|nr:MAG: glycogen synthase isoform 1 [Bathelium mastoideum]